MTEGDIKRLETLGKVIASSLEKLAKAADVIADSLRDGKRDNVCDAIKDVAMQLKESL